MKSSIFAAVAYSALAEEGQKTVCLGPRAHLITYKIEGQGDTLETVDSADIEITRSAEDDQVCAPNGWEDDALFCFGANTDETCSYAAASIPLTDNFECNSCWIGLTTDLYYKISTTFGVPTKAEVGIRNSKIVGALQVHAHGDAATEVTSGSVDLFAPEAHVDFMAGSIPLNFTFSLPTRIDYNVGLKGAINANAGAAMDSDFGDHGVAYSPVGGFQWINTPVTFSLDPMLEVDSGDSGADMGLALAGVIKVQANDLAWYNVDFSAGLPSKLVVEESTALPGRICFESDVDVPVNQEAEVHKKVLGKDVVVYHYGPAELTHYHKDQALLKCTDSSAAVFA